MSSSVHTCTLSLSRIHSRGYETDEQDFDRLLADLLRVAISAAGAEVVAAAAAADGGVCSGGCCCSVVTAPAAACCAPGGTTEPGFFVYTNVNVKNQIGKQ